MILAHWASYKLFMKMDFECCAYFLYEIIVRERFKFIEFCWLLWFLAYAHTLQILGKINKITELFLCAILRSTIEYPADWD